MYTLSYGVAIIFFTIWSIICFMHHILAIIYGKKLFHKNNTRSNVPLLGVSILKPLMGIDHNLSSNLETFFTMDYPKYELSFCIESESDPAIELVKTLMKKYPEIKAGLFVGGSNVGINPKINNMYTAYKNASHEFVLISDSGIRMKENTLRNMMSFMSEKTAIVHQIPFTSDREGFAAVVEKIYFGATLTFPCIFANLVGLNNHVGMSSLMRKSPIDDIGLKYFSKYLAEDFFMAKHLIDSGWRIRNCNEPALQNSGICKIKNHMQRITRWSKLRASMTLTFVFCEPFLKCPILGVCAAWAANVLFKCNFLLFFSIHILVWLTIDWKLLCVVQNGKLPFNKFNFVKAWLFSECLSIFVYIIGALNREIHWRSRVFRVAWGGETREIKPNTETNFLF